MAEEYKQVIADKKAQAKRLMNKRQMTKCNVTIHTAAVAAALAGAIPIPMVDAIPISASQVTMAVVLGKIFNVKITEGAAKGAIGAAASTLVGRQLVKWIPGVGWVVSAAVAAGVTEAIGWTIAVDFAKDAKNRWIKERTAEPENENTTDEDNGADIIKNADSMKRRAEPFLSGGKKPSEFKDEFNGLLADIEKILDGLPDNDPLYAVYDELCMVACK